MYKIPKIENHEDIKSHLDGVLEQLKITILNMDLKKAKPLIYWLNDWGGYFLKKEEAFDPNRLIKYERGMVVQAHLGFKVGSEQGGLHYALIVENNNGLNDNVVMVVPLRSLKDKERPEDIDKRFEVYLGEGIFDDDIQKAEDKINDYEKIISHCLADIESKNKTQNDNKINDFKKKLSKIKNKLKSFQKGTVAQIGQMCCLSKLRIYHPTFNGDDLSNFKLNPNKLDNIDELIHNLYAKPKIGK